MTTTHDSPLVEHARRELQLAGLFSEDADYGPMIGDACLAIIEVFASQGHSGVSAAHTTAIVTKLMAYEPLTELTNDPADWIDVSEMSGRPMWQCRRHSAAFSEDGGKTYTVLGSDTRFTAKEANP